MIKKIQLDDVFMLEIAEEKKKVKVNINWLKLYLIDWMLREKINTAKIKDIKKAEERLKKLKVSELEFSEKIKEYHSTFDKYVEVKVYVKEENVIDRVNALLALS